MTKSSVAFIGLGTMGYPMAGWLQQKGYDVVVFNRTVSTAEKWVKECNGISKKSIREAVLKVHVVITCVGNDKDLREVYYGAEGILENVAEGAILIDHTTSSAEVAREIANEAKKKKNVFFDAPVSGGEQGAQKGLLTIMCGGEVEAFDNAKKIMDSYARSCVLMGKNGAGQLTKMVNQICLAGLIQSLSEGLHFAECSGLDPKQVVEVISKGAAQSWQMDNRHASMIAGEYTHGFAVDWMRKDLGICLDQAKKIGASLPIVALVDQFYAEVQKMGGSRWDTSSLLARLKQRS